MVPLINILGIGFNWTKIKEIKCMQKLNIGAKLLVFENWKIKCFYFKIGKTKL